MPAASGCMRAEYRLHALPQAESGEGVLNAFAEGDGRASEGDAEVVVCREAKAVEGGNPSRGGEDGGHRLECE
jgi:hypothetical protein